MTVKEIFSADKKRKCVITKSEKNFLSYHFEVHETYDEEGLKYFPAGCATSYWRPLCEAYHRPVFDNIDDLMRELVYDPEYKTYFGLQTLDK